jgi:predicted protein tyrosine phosphatase
MLSTLIGPTTNETKEKLLDGLKELHQNGSKMYSNNYLTKMNENFNIGFAEGTKNAAIFKTNAPYNNPYQGSSDRWLFVCSAGLLRSPTGAAVAITHGINSRACGSNFNYALIPCSANLINWADKIIFVNQENLLQVEDNFLGHDYLLQQVERKAVVLNIPDNYEYMDPALVGFFEAQLPFPE